MKRAYTILEFLLNHTLLKWLQIVVKEIVLEDNEVSKGLLDYINGHCVTNIVLGASSRSALGRLLSLSFSVSYAALWRKNLNLAHNLFLQEILDS